MFFQRPQMVTADQALPDRNDLLWRGPVIHEVLGSELRDRPPGCELACFAMGCFWGAEKLFWETPGVLVTAVGYSGGFTANPTYEEVCSGRTGHAETVLVVFDPDWVSYADLLRIFFENHDPTQGYRQGNDVGTQYRSAIYANTEEQLAEAKAIRDAYQTELTARGFAEITTEIEEADLFYYAEKEHQQYGAKMEKQGRAWYCPIHSTGVACSPAD